MIKRTKRQLYRELASLVNARLNCIEKGNTTWEHNHTDKIHQLVKDHLASGSGIDRGTTIDLDKSTGEKLVFRFGYHHMDEQGGYDGWTEHTLTVTASLQFGYVFRISGRDRNGIKEYLHEVYANDLEQEVVI